MESYQDYVGFDLFDPHHTRCTHYFNASLEEHACNISSMTPRRRCLSQAMVWPPMLWPHHGFIEAPNWPETNSEIFFVKTIIKTRLMQFFSCPVLLAHGRKSLAMINQAHHSKSHLAGCNAILIAGLHLLLFKISASLLFISLATNYQPFTP